MGDVFEMMTYLVVVILSCIIMTVWLKRKSRKNKQ
ncbi:hypothetical protein FHS14_000690 [Paenibacillus baekrokdamisoli]|nr:hypothetical protein [Paenibacillus baekrokdamisoli]